MRSKGARVEKVVRVRLYELKNSSVSTAASLTIGVLAYAKRKCNTQIYTENSSISSLLSTA